MGGGGGCGKQVLCDVGFIGGFVGLTADKVDDEEDEDDSGELIPFILVTTGGDVTRFLAEGSDVTKPLPEGGDVTRLLFEPEGDGILLLTEGGEVKLLFDDAGDKMPFSGLEGLR